MQTLVIGDIHGCYQELQALLDKAGLTSGDAIITIGNLVDRGPETPQVLDFFRENAAARALLGNHESKHVRAARGELKLALSQQISRQQFGAAYPQAVAWSQQDELALGLLIEKVRQANASLLARLVSTPGFADLSARQLAKLYAFEAGPGAFATLMQLARVNKLDLDAARRILKEPGEVQKIAAQRNDAENPT